MKISCLLLSTLLLATTLFAEEGDSLQQLRDEIHALKQRISALELRFAEQQAKLRKDQTQAEPAQALSAPLTTAPARAEGGILGNIKSSGSNLVEDLRNGFHSTNKPAEGKWTNPANWTKIQKGMHRQQVEAFLGNAAAVKSSIKLRVDDYWLYIGKMPNGNTLQGRVRFYKDKVTSWQTPRF